VHQDYGIALAFVELSDFDAVIIEICHRFSRRMIFSDLPSPAEAGFAKAGNRFPLFGIMRFPGA